MSTETAAEAADEAPAKPPKPTFGAPTEAMLASDLGMDYMPLAELLMEGNFQDADQFTRDALIKIAGAGAVDRNFVYWTDVKGIPVADLRSIERQWLAYSGGKFGYTVQKNVWKVQKGDFEGFCRKIGWSTKDSDVERKLRWFGASEFTYDTSAPRGHLPLTSALRGTTLLKKLLDHPAWDLEDGDTEFDGKKKK